MSAIFRTAAISLLLFIAAAQPVSAEFYKYVDSRGITHFTDTFSTIPPQYQAQIAQHADISPPLEIMQTKKPAVPAPVPGEISELAIKHQRLLDKKEILNKKYEVLMAEKQALENSRQTIESETEIIAYNTRVQQINKKIKWFKIEENQFMTELDQFNRFIDSH